MQQAVAAIASIPWHLDMRQHAHELATRVQRGVQAVLPSRPHFHRKSYLAQDTKSAILEKAAWRKTTLQLQAVLRVCFRSWACVSEPPTWDWLADCERTLGWSWAMQSGTMRLLCSAEMPTCSSTS